MKKINELWLKFKKWSEVNLLGYLIGSIVKIVLLFFVLTLLFYLLFVIGPLRDKTNSENPVASNSEENNCNIAGINLNGELLAYIPLHGDNDTSYDFNYDSFSSEDIVGKIKQANDDPAIKAIILEINSGGGSPIGGEEISDAVKNSNKPIVGLIRGIGASSSYYAVSSADKIFASKYSEVGGIGITMSYLSNVKKNIKDGYSFEQISAGYLKDAGNVNKPLTKEERDLFIKDTNTMYDNFIKAVSDNRKIPLDEVKTIATGATVLGEKAKELKLIDEIGSLNEVQKYLEGKIGEKSVVCW